MIAPRRALGALITAVPELAGQNLRVGGPPDASQPPGDGEDTFATTTAKTTLIAHLDPASAELIRATTAISVAAAQAITPASVAARAAAWLAGDHLYQLRPPPPGPPAAHLVRPRTVCPVTPLYLRRDGIEVRNLLASNAEYARFLNVLAQSGMPNNHAGSYLLGNLQTWCADGPDTADCLNGPPARWLYGAAWNTPGTLEEAQRPRHRHILGCSRGVGIRLVRDGTQQAVSDGELAGRLASWIAVLANRSRPLAELDEWLIQALDGSQADAGLGPHIAPGTGKTSHG